MRRLRPFGTCLAMFLTYVILLASGVGAYNVTLSKRSTLYIPYTYEGDPNGKYELDRNPSEKLVHDPEKQIVYLAGRSLIHVINISNPDSMEILTYREYPNMVFTDVELCGGHVFAGIDNLTDSSRRGKIIIFSEFNRTLDELVQIELDSNPDTVKATPDCSKLVISLEAVVYENATGYPVDPPGQVVIVTFTSGVHNYTITSLDFTQFDNQVSSLELSGVRHVYQEDNNPFSNDVEPEGITFNNDVTVAYVGLQENNAIAEIDLVNKNILKIHGLGFKNWSDSRLDPSDDDNGPMLYPYNLLGMYQPDSIVHFTFKGDNYIATANEGSDKLYLYGSYSWVEEARAGRLDSAVVDKLDFLTRDQISRDTLLGRHKVSTSGSGFDSSGKLKALYSFGARSFSIRRADDMSLVYDSGANLTVQLLLNENNLFNSEFDDPVERPFETYDTRSDNRGLEPETIAIGEVDGITLLFIGCERPGVIFVYSLNESISAPTFQDFYIGIPETRSKSWQVMYTERTISEVDPEDIEFVPADKSPTNSPILLVTGSVSGTLSILDININSTAAQNIAVTAQASSVGTLLVAVALTLLNLVNY